MVDLNTNVTGRSGTVEYGNLTILCLQQSLRGLLGTYTQMYLCNLCQSRDTSLELLLLTLEGNLEVLTQRHRIECADKDGFGSVFGVCNYVVGTAAEESEQTAFHEQRLHVLLNIERLCFLLLVALNTNREQFAAVATLHKTDNATDGRRKLHFGMQLVHKQGITSKNLVAFLYDNLRLETREIIGLESIFSRTFHLTNLIRRFAFQVDIEALTQLDYFCHIFKKCE